MTPPRVLLLSSALASLVAPAIAQGIEFSTLLGGAGADRAYAVARSTDGRVFVAGYTPSPGFLGTTGPNGPSDGFVACFDPAQSGPAQLRWVTLIGGSGDEATLAMQVDATGAQVTVTGYTTSTDLTTTAGAFQLSFGGGVFDGFVARLDGATGAVGWATYCGGNDDDWFCDLAVEANGDVTCGGVTYATDYPVRNGMKTNVTGLTDVTVTTFDPTQQGAAQLLYSTLIGGSGEEGEWITSPNVVFGLLGTAVHVDGRGIVTVGSRTNSRNFPTTGNVHQAQHGGGAAGTDFDAFVMQIDRAQSGAAQRLWATYLGGSANDGITDLGMDASGEPVVAGYTASTTDFPTTPGAYQTAYAGGTYDDFVARLSVGGTSLVASTLLGGSLDREYLFGLDVASSGMVSVVGYTFSADFPTTAGCLQPAVAGAFDAFVSRLDPTLSRLWYSTFLGGNDADPFDAIAPDGFGGVLAAGLTLSSTFPTTPGAYQSAPGGASDAVVAHLDMQPAGCERRGSILGAPTSFQTVSEAPSSSAAAFQISCHGAPANAAGFLLVSFPQDPALPVLGFEIHVALPAMLSPVNASPLGFVETPALPVAGLPAGARVATQFVWLNGSVLDVSNGLFLTF
jgi:hypothetical protein